MFGPTRSAWISALRAAFCLLILYQARWQSAYTSRSIDLLEAGALLFAAAGLWTRPALAVALVSFSLGHAFEHRLFAQNMGTPAVWLLILLCAPGVDAWGLDGWRRRGRRWHPSSEEDTVSRWPLFAIRWFVGLGYLSAAYQKITLGGWAYLDGSALRYHMLRSYMITGAEPALATARSAWACLLGGWFVLAFEATFILCVFAPRWSPLYVGLACLLHAVMYATMDILILGFFMGLLAFLEPAGRRRGRAAA